MESYISLLVDEIKTVVIGTIDKKLNPNTKAIDLMMYKNNRIYFLIEKEKELYKDLKRKTLVSITGYTNGNNPLEKVVVTLKGKVNNIGKDMLEEIFDSNEYMKEIYPTEKSRETLEVFEIYEGKINVFDSTNISPLTKDFNFGKYKEKDKIYYINGNCTNCGQCLKYCPSKSIKMDEFRTYIDLNSCISCGNCKEICSFDGVSYKK